MCKSYLLKLVSVALLLFFTTAVNISAQVVVAGTEFTPLTPVAGKTYYSIVDVGQYGMITGALQVTPSLTPNTNANIFNNTAYYGITTICFFGVL